MNKTDNRPKKSGLSPGYKTDVYSKLDQLLYNKDLEFYGDVEDEYIRIAISTFLDDLKFKSRDSNGRYLYVSVEEGIYRFIDNRPDVRVYDLPSDWETFTLKISTYIKDNPLEEDNSKEFSMEEYKKDMEENSEKSSRVFMIDSDNNRYYKGYTNIKNGEDYVEVILVSYDNEVKFDCEWVEGDGDSFFNIEDKKKFVETLTIGDISDDIYDKSVELGDRVKLTIYDSKKDGLLETKLDKEIKELGGELEERGYATLSDGRIIVSDKEKMKEYLEDYKEVLEDYKESNGYDVGDEFIFAVGDGSDLGIGLDYFLVIQPKSYWDNERCQYDQHMIYRNLPNGVLEVMESTFEYIGTIEDNIRELVKRGFVFESEFQDFIQDGNNVIVNNNMSVSDFVDTL